MMCGSCLLGRWRRRQQYRLAYSVARQHQRRIFLLLLLRLNWHHAAGHESDGYRTADLNHNVFPSATLQALASLSDNKCNSPSAVEALMDFEGPSFHHLLAISARE